MDQELSCIEVDVDGDGRYVDLQADGIVVVIRVEPDSAILGKFEKDKKYRVTIKEMNS